MKPRVNGHHPKSIELMLRLSEIDFKRFDDYFDWNTGGEGDNGEVLLNELDIIFDEDDVLDYDENRQR